MRPLHNRLQEARIRLGVPWEVLERDYVLSWMLAGIEQVDILRNTLIFKGGTALKKCYFGDYRFSEDLDFSAIGDAPSGDEMETAIGAACNEAARLLDEYAPVGFDCTRYTERHPHPSGQEAFTIRARLPYHRAMHTRVKIEIAMDEPVLKPHQQMQVIHEYGEPIKIRVLTYSLEEIIAEKLRALLQHAEKLERRGWGRSRARDYYDLWRILDAYRDKLDLTGFQDFLKGKCAVRDVAFRSSDDFFQEILLSQVSRTWEQWLAPLVRELPSFGTVIDELHPQIALILGV